MAVILETNRLILRTWTLDDADAAFMLWGDPEVMRFVGSSTPHQNLNETHRWLQWAIAYQEEYGFCRWALVEKATGKIIGSCGFLSLDDGSEIDLGYYLAPPFWGQGYGTEIAEACLRYGFEKLMLREIVATVDHRHSASQRVLEKIGFIFQGRRPSRDTDEKIYLAVNPEGSK